MVGSRCTDLCVCHCATNGEMQLVGEVVFVHVCPAFLDLREMNDRCEDGALLFLRIFY